MSGMSGKTFVPAFFGGLAIFFAVFISLLLFRAKQEPLAVIAQMKEAPRCAILTAPSDGIRGSGLLAWLQSRSEPELQEAARSLEQASLAVEKVGAGPLPMDDQGRTVGWVELGWDGSDSDAPLEGVVFVCVDGLISEAQTVNLPRGPRRVRSQGSMLLPPKRGAFASPAVPLPASGPGVAENGYRQRCLSTENPLVVDCTLEVFDRGAKGYFETVYRYAIARKPVPGHPGSSGPFERLQNIEGKLHGEVIQFDLDGQATSCLCGPLVEGAAYVCSSISEGAGEEACAGAPWALSD